MAQFPARPVSVTAGTTDEQAALGMMRDAFGDDTPAAAPGIGVPIGTVVRINGEGQPVPALVDASEIMVAVDALLEANAATPALLLWLRSVADWIGTKPGADEVEAAKWRPHHVKSHMLRPGDVVTLEGMSGDPEIVKLDAHNLTILYREVTIVSAFDDAGEPETVHTFPRDEWVRILTQEEINRDA